MSIISSLCAVSVHVSGTVRLRFLDFVLIPLETRQGKASHSGSCPRSAAAETRHVFVLFAQVNFWLLPWFDFMKAQTFLPRQRAWTTGDTLLAQVVRN